MAPRTRSTQDATSTKSTRTRKPPVTKRKVIGVSSATSESTVSPRTRATDTHIFFWGGILSNWHLDSPPFGGARGLALMQPRFDALGIKYPDDKSLSTRLLAAHSFVCGEQWMMAVKAWLFERLLVLGEKEVNLESEESTATVIGKREYEAIRMNTVQSPSPETSAFLHGSLCTILSTSEPKLQKALGRQVQGFDDTIWTKSSTAIVIAGCIARAELDPALRAVYEEGKTRRFVEGSPMDKVWGVGLKWDNPRIDDEANWRGENRLGKCHDEAAAYIRQRIV